LAPATEWQYVGVESTERTGITSELGSLIETLSNNRNVYVRHGRFASGVTPARRPGALAVEVYGLVAELHRYWKQYASGGTAPASVPQIEASLEPLAADAAVELMTALAADDLLWPGFTHMERDEAHCTATHVVELLGPDATWWSNRDDHAWSAVTACTLDGVIAGSDDEHFAILIQVCED